MICYINIDDNLNIILFFKYPNLTTFFIRPKPETVIKSEKSNAYRSVNRKRRLEKLTKVCVVLLNKKLPMINLFKET